jgi:hypothetical protein
VVTDDVERWVSFEHGADSVVVVLVDDDHAE